ncbi:hypothetical protein ACB092_04G160900 [Castanea dentata]
MNKMRSWMSVVLAVLTAQRAASISCSVTSVREYHN